jgi:quinol monooxygenase YgiN
MISVIATIELRRGKRAPYLEAFEEVAPAVRAEQGCLEYEACIDVPSGSAAQLPLRPDVVTIVEKWSDLAALQAHFKASHMAAFSRRSAPYVARTTLQVLQPTMHAD